MTRPPGRPEIGPVFNLRLPPHVTAELDRRADHADVSRAEMARRMLTEAIGDTMYTVETDAISGAVQAILGDIQAEANSGISQEGRLGTQVVLRYADADALAYRLRRSGHEVIVEPFGR